MIPKGSLGFKGREFEKFFSFKTLNTDIENDFLDKSLSPKNWATSDELARSSSNLSERNCCSTFPEPESHRDQAALKLQKVYKSFRTRRKLADCAVLAEQRWWKVLDFAELKRTSISFFDIEKSETATARWSRARKRAAKVGKGLSRDCKARKLALQHWLEAIDPRHRYGHNLQFYYVRWLHCDSNQPFFYWLDIGQGKEVNPERCPRSRLQKQCIKYLGPVERKAYEVVVEDGRLYHQLSGKPVDTTGDAKWIFVLSTSKTLYVGQKNKGTFQHSSFLAGGATLSAGRLAVEDGVLRSIWPHSGHYLPTEENSLAFMKFLEEHNVDLTNVKGTPSDDEEENIPRKNKDLLIRTNPTEAELPQNGETECFSTSAEEISELRNEDSNAVSNPLPQPSRLSRGLKSKISELEIPQRNLSDILNNTSQPQTCYFEPPDSFSDGYETAEEAKIDEEEFMFAKSNLSEYDQKEEDENPIPTEKIMKRIDSHKGMKSYQLAYQLSSRWTTGAGPRIGCMRDYPTELQFRVLERANLSPRSRNPPAASHQRAQSLSRFSPLMSPLPPSDVQI